MFEIALERQPVALPDEEVPATPAAVPPVIAGEPHADDGKLVKH